MHALQKHIMLNTSKSSNYKALAKKTKPRECITSDNPLSEIVVDFRSRLFMYIRTEYINKPLKQKINALFIAMDDMQKEKKRVYEAAIATMKMEVSLMRVDKVTYVFPSTTACPYKKHIKSIMSTAAKTRLVEFESRVQEFKRDMLDVDLLDRCIAALESYMVSDLEGICTVYRGKEWMLVSEAKFIVPKKDDMFESDRTCARLGRSSAILSEDFDCLAFFGANMMVKEVYRGFFSYIVLKDLMELFKSRTRKNLVEKCCLMGSDYNFGLKGVGPVKVTKIDTLKTSKLCKTCLSAQSIKPEKLWNFFMT